MLRLLVFVVGLVMITAALTGLPASALPPPDPPDPPGGDPPAPPSDDEPGAEWSIDVILPTAETIVYDGSEISGELTCADNVRVANDEMLVVFDPQATIEEIDSALAAVGAWKKADIQATGEWVAGFLPVGTCEALQAKIDQLETNPLVLSSAKCTFGDYCFPPNDPKYPADFGQDPSFSGQWNLRRAGIDFGWDKERGKGNYSTIGIVDSGAELTHPDLAAHLVSGSEAWTVEPHGTGCAGVAAAVTNNGVGVAGVGWDARILIKNAVGLSESQIVQKVAAISTTSSTTPGGIVDISMSFGGASKGTAGYEAAINEAFRQGILPVAATGNENGEFQRWPACFTRTMAVGASWKWLTHVGGITGYECRWQDSNYGNQVSVLAPSGWQVISTTWPRLLTPSGYNDLFGGTSASTPQVAGLAALVRSEYQSMGPLDIRHRIEDTAFDQVAPYAYPNAQAYPLGDSPTTGEWDKWTGWGLVDGYATLTSQPVNMTITGNRWNLMVIPIWPKENPNLIPWQASAFPQNVLPAAYPGGNRYIMWLKPGNSQYYTQSQYTGQDQFGNTYPYIGLVKPYKAFWVKYTNVASLSPAPQGARAIWRRLHNLEFPVARGYNMIGNPSSFYPLPFRDQNIRFRLGNASDADTKNLSQAISASWIAGQLAWWDPVANQYVYVSPNTGHQMPLFRGYFMRVNVDNLYMLVKRS